MPSGILDRFEEGTDERTTWSKLVKAVEAKVCSPAGGGVPGLPLSLGGQPAPRAPRAPRGSPDLCIDPCPADLVAKITPETMDLATALAVDNVSLGLVRCMYHLSPLHGVCMAYLHVVERLSFIYLHTHVRLYMCACVCFPFV
jgi:hypothetical protein